MPEDYPDFPHHTQIKAYLDAYADAFGLRERIEFRNGVVHAARLRERRLGDRPTQAGDDPPLRPARRRQRPPLGPADRGVPGRVHRRVHPLPPLHRPVDAAHLMDKRILVVGLGNSAADIAVELSQRALRNQVTLSTRSAARGSCRS